MWHDILDQSIKLRAEEEPFVLATVVAFKSPQSARPGSKAIIKSDGSIDGWIGGGCVQPIVIREAKKALQTGRPVLVSITPDSTREDWKGVQSYEMTCQGGGSMEIYLEPVIPKPDLLIIGNSPLAQILTGLGRLLDFKVSVADTEASQERFPDADLVITDLGSARSRINSQSYVVIATMGAGDEEGLLAAVGTSPKYMGLVASKEKATSLFQYLRDKGTPAEHIEKIKCPAGLELGGETLPEIALSVMAEITRLRRVASNQITEPTKKSKGAGLPILQTVEAQSMDESRDPVCGMMVAREGARYKTVFGDETFYFCCLRCKESFDGSPQLYLETSRAGET
jgi:xanthine dehydrogenase accessory factor